MKTTTYSDGSKSYFYENGDLVEFIADDHYSTFNPYKKGDWGKVVLIAKEDKMSGISSITSFVGVQIAGVSTPKDSFIQCYSSVPVWDLQPKQGMNEL